MIKIGAVNIDTSHPLAFSKIFNAENRARYAAVYNDGFRGDDEVDGFIKSAGMKARAGSIEELADMTDIGFIQGCNWDTHLAQALPFIQKNKPVFIDKPVVGNLADCEALLALSAKGATILGSSSVRYCREIADFLAQPTEERGEIIHAYGSCGVDDFNYAIHTVEGLGAIMGTGAVGCKFCGRGKLGKKTADTYSVSYENGKMALYTAFQGAWHTFEFLIMTEKKTVHINVDTNSLYKSMLDLICDYMETGVNKLASAEALAESVKIMLAGKASFENGGVSVALSELDRYNPAFDGSAFEREYAAAASKIYV